MYVESFEKLSGNAMFEGFAVDLADELSKLLGFNYTFKLVEDGKVGYCEVPAAICTDFYSTGARRRPGTGTACWARWRTEWPTL